MAGKTASNKSSSGTSGGAKRYQIPGALDYRDKDYLRKKSAVGSKTAGTGAVKSRTTAGNRTGSRRKKKSSYRVLYGVLGGSLGVALMLVLMLLVQYAGRKGNAPGTGSVNNVSAQPFVEDTSRNYLSINMDSCTVIVGQEFWINISAYPAELRDSVIWSSNNEEVLIVDQTGYVWIVGEGIAALTATSGEYSDAIAVEAVANASAQTSLGLPLYSRLVEGSQPDPVSPSPEGNGQENSGGSDVPEESGEYASENNGTEGGGSYQRPEGEGSGQTGTDNSGATAEPPTAPAQPTQPSTDVPPEEQPGGQEPDTQPPAMPTQPETTAAPSIDTDEMFAVLSATGFSPYLSNACIYEEDEVYLGEIIVASDSVHIYIKQRSADFDNAVKSALSYLLPNTAETVWNSYLAATSDRTISSDGRKVRFVMPAANAHSQIIVYNP